MLNVGKSIIKFKENAKKKGQIGGFNNIASLTGSLKVKECLPCNLIPKKNGMNIKSCFVMSSNYYEFFAVAVFFCFMENARITFKKK